ncbi:MAG: hypothetical protein NVSMB57_06710 [Actinomycetota bacterium]
MDRLAGAASVKPSIQSEPNLAVVADPLRLRHVLINLIDNAVKYTPSGGQVSIRAYNSNGTVKIAVSDSGVGIPEEERAQIFEPFYRVQGVETQHGEASSGLGLALAKRLIVAQDGSIRCDSEIGHGSTFTVEMPSAPSTNKQTKTKG